MNASGWAAAAGCLMLMAGCGDAPRDGSLRTSADDQVEVSCGGDASWAPSTMAEGIPGVLTDQDAKAAFQSILDDPRTGGEASLSLFPNGVDVEWRALAHDGDDLTLGLGKWTERGPAPTGATVLALHKEGDGWSSDGWGSCSRLAPVLDDGSTWAHVDAYRTAGPRSLEVDVSETECTSGRDPDEYLHEPTIVETADTVTLFWTSTRPKGANTCPGNPSATRIVELDETLGSRTVLDGSAYPPRPVRQE